MIERHLFSHLQARVSPLHSATGCAWISHTVGIKKSVMGVEVCSFESVASLAQSFGLSLIIDVALQICTLLLDAFIIKDLHKLHHCQINQQSQCYSFLDLPSPLPPLMSASSRMKKTADASQTQMVPQPS